MPSTREQQLEARLRALQTRGALQRQHLALVAAPLVRAAGWVERALVLRHALLPALIPVMWLIRRWWRRRLPRR